MIGSGVQGEVEMEVKLVMQLVERERLWGWMNALGICRCGLRGLAVSDSKMEFVVTRVKVG